MVWYNRWMQSIAAALGGPGVYVWVVLPVLIFLARICDVSLGTVRLVFVARGYKYLAPLVGFFEVLIRVITQKETNSLVERLNDENYGVPRLAGQGANGPVEVIFTIVPRRAVQSVVELVKKFNPHAFYSIEDVDFVEKGVFPMKRSWPSLEALQPLRMLRKGK
jgi:uncharacterized protein YebE (UPF0316 family)